MTALEQPTEQIAEPQTVAELHELMRRLATVRSRIAENEATAEVDRAAALARIDAWLDAETRNDRAYAASLEEQCAAYLLTHMPEHRKSIRTPWGSIQSRDGGDAIDWGDEPVLLAWAAEKGYLRTRVVESIDKAAIRKACHVAGDRLVTADGECVPGVSVSAKGRSVEVTM